MTENISRYILPKYIKDEDDLRFIMTHFHLSDKDLDIIMHALLIVEKNIDADELKHKKVAKEIFSNLFRKESLLSDDAKLLVSILANGKYINRAKAWFAKMYAKNKDLRVINRENKSVKKNENQTYTKDKDNYYFWKLQTNQNFRAWSESILQRAQPGAKKVLDYFIQNPTSKLVFSCSNPYKMRYIVYFPYNEDKTIRKHLLMQEVFSNYKLRSIIDAPNFKMYILLSSSV